MSEEKVQREFYRKIVYTENQWQIFKKKRIQAINLIELFEKQNLN